MCLHHYDEIELHAGMRSTGDICGLLKAPVAGSVAAKSLLCFRFDGNAGSGFRIDNADPLFSVVMLRINQHLKGMPSLELEDGVFSHIEPHLHGAHWALYRTFAKKELILLLHGSSLARVETLLWKLENARVKVDGHDVLGFDVVEFWPCISRELWDAVDLNGSGREREPRVAEFLEEESVAVRALRVVGTCRQLSNQHVCSAELDSTIRKAVRPPGPEPDTPGEPEDAAKRWRPISGIYLERQVDRPASTVLDILRHTKQLRTTCRCTDSCCSVYLTRAKHAVPDKTGVEPIALPTDTGKLRGLRVDPSRPLAAEPGPDFSRITEKPGSRFIGLRLEEIRWRLLQALSNPFIAPEFEDLRDFLSTVFDRLVALYREGPQDPACDPVLWWSNLRGQSQNIANYLEYAIQERAREDVCGYIHHFQFSPLNASGFSRIAPVGSHAIASQLRAHGIEYRGLCINGYLPTYRELCSFPFINSDLRATLEPFYHFGLGHETGHIVYNRELSSHPVAERQDLADKLHHPSYRKLFTEFFADGFCLLTTFCNDLDAYLQAWVRHFLDVLEYDYQYQIFLEISPAEVVNHSLRKVLQYVARLNMTAFLHFLRAGLTAEKLWTRATARVLEAFGRERGGNAAMSSTVASQFARDTEDFSKTAADPRPHPEAKGWDRRFFEDFESVAKELYTLLERFEKNEHLSISRVDACVRDWQHGILPERELTFPLAAMSRIWHDVPPDSAGEFATNVAVILSMCTWSERFDLS